ncbi:hypothetical protein GA0115236_12055 [Streptomyces sp. IgraMP-1]|nr:hypothetical protein GA0115236_12055 [Streptomyces sp. IgraMP-1]
MHGPGTFSGGRRAARTGKDGFRPTRNWTELFRHLPPTAGERGGVPAGNSAERLPATVGRPSGGSPARTRSGHSFDAHLTRAAGSANLPLGHRAAPHGTTATRPSPPTVFLRFPFCPGRPPAAPSPPDRVPRGHAEGVRVETHLPPARRRRRRPRRRHRAARRHRHHGPGDRGRSRTGRQAHRGAYRRPPGRPQPRPARRPDPRRRGEDRLRHRRTRPRRTGEAARPRRGQGPRRHPAHPLRAHLGRTPRARR